MNIYNRIKTFFALRLRPKPRLLFRRMQNGEPTECRGYFIGDLNGRAPSLIWILPGLDYRLETLVLVHEFEHHSMYELFLSGVLTLEELVWVGDIIDIYDDILEFSTLSIEKYVDKLLRS